MTDESDISGEPLTPAENKKLRRMIRDEERMIWLWATIRVWLGWGTAVAAAAYAAYEPIWRAAKAVFNK